MTELMKGKRGLVMGVANDHSIAWGIAKTLADHGAELAFTFQGEALGRRVKPLAESVGGKILLPCDVEDLASVDMVFAELKNAQAIALVYDGASPQPPTYCYLKLSHLERTRTWFEQVARGEV